MHDQLLVSRQNRTGTSNKTVFGLSSRLRITIQRSLVWKGTKGTGVWKITIECLLPGRLSQILMINASLATMGLKNTFTVQFKTIFCSFTLSYDFLVDVGGNYMYATERTSINFQELSSLWKNFFVNLYSFVKYFLKYQNVLSSGLS